MEWFWILFVLLSIVGTLIEKLGKNTGTPAPAPPKRKRPEWPSPSLPPLPRPETLPPLFEENTEKEFDVETVFAEGERGDEGRDLKEEEKTESETERPPFTPAEGLPSLLMESPVYTSAEGEELPSPEFSGFPGIKEEEREGRFEGLGTEAEFLTEVGKEETEISADDEGLIRTGDLLSAFLLAHVLKRPDFKTVPWQRRL